MFCNSSCNENCNYDKCSSCSERYACLRNGYLGSLAGNSCPCLPCCCSCCPQLGFAFTKKSDTGANLPGAVFVLSSCCGTIRAVSGSDGKVCFPCLPPGIYQLREISAPTGYAPDTTAHTVFVCGNGTALIDGLPASNFIAINTQQQSATPGINAIFPGDSLVCGTGVPGSTITVTFPGGITSTATVNSDGTWCVSVPSGVTLSNGDTVSAVQTTPGQSPSNPATGIVQGISEKPIVNPVFEGDTIITGPAFREV